MAKTGKKKNDKENASSVNATEENEETSRVLQSNRNKVTKGERRARKMMSTLGLKLLPEVHKIIVKKSAKMAFAIVNAEVYKINGTDSYVIFGDARSDDLSNPLNSLVSDKLKDVKMDADTLAAAAEALTEGKGKGKEKGKGKGKGRDNGKAENISKDVTDDEKGESGKGGQEKIVKNDMEKGKEQENKQSSSSGDKNKAEVKEKAAETDNSELPVDPDDVQLVIGQTGSTAEEAIACLRKNKNDIVQTIIELSK